MQLPAPSLPALSSRTVPVAQTVRAFAPQDWLVLGYHAVFLVAILASHGPARPLALLQIATLLGIASAAVIAVRSGFLRHPVIAPLVYRLALYGTVQTSYFFLRDILPLIAPYSLDAQLTTLDIRLFGAEPTLVVDRFVTPHTTEYFAFFYYSYFFILASHVVPMLFGSRDRALLTEFALVMLGCVCITHTMYSLVPGYGPHDYLAAEYKNQLPSGFWFDLVMKAVNAGGAMKDIFPSLHTCAPTALAIFSFRHRNRLPFTYTWPIVAFFALNIIGATIFLRWHYLVDVVAGLALAITANLVAGRLTAVELARRERLGLGDPWPEMPKLGPATEAVSER